MSRAVGSDSVQSVYERLKRDLWDFRMRPGDRYAESELVTRYGVSRTPLRVALYMLVREGYFVKVVGHSGWMVRPLDLAHFEDLYDVRVGIELMAIQRICRAEAFPDLKHLRGAWLVRPADRVTDGALLAQFDEQFHAAIVAAAGSPEMSRIHADLTDRIRIIRRLDFLAPARLATTYEEHGKLLRALLARKEGDAALLLRAHIESSKAEIRHITLHKLALATAEPEANERRLGARHAL